MTIKCRECPFLSTCFPAPLTRGELDAFERSIEQSTLRAGKALTVPGERFRAYYVIRSGALKIAAHNGDDRERILRFHFPGEISGFAEAAHGAWLGAMVGLSDVDFCRIPQAAVRSPVLLQRLATLAGERLLHNYEFALAIKNRSRAKRLAAFLIQLRTRLSPGGEPCRELRLPMTQVDIANYLGLTKESISRAFAELKQRGYVEQHGRHVRILNADSPALEQFVEEGE
ncbi:MAG TPA: Crp/Fnr family transcriptional regulator [Gammaproteobacteria bacterium]|nr:Crp/Fnr family transcriptional regulator [Gammaproteobacteria bacterium]